ncbi:MAG: class I SAM-dependent methyltransferase [Promethearchaeota archaeon]
MQEKLQNEIKLTYDNVANEYGEYAEHALAKKSLDRKILELFAERVGSSETVYDIGCGPGTVTRYLKGLGVSIVGIDISTKMVEIARKLNPKIHFEQGDVFNLKLGENTLGGIIAFYLIINFPRADIPKVSEEMFRVLRQGGTLLLTFHVGEKTIPVEEYLGKKVTMNFTLFQPEEIKAILQRCGFQIGEIVVRTPYTDVERDLPKAYIFARKPSWE